MSEAKLLLCPLCRAIVYEEKLPKHCCKYHSGMTLARDTEGRYFLMTGDFKYIFFERVKLSHE